MGAPRERGVSTPSVSDRLSADGGHFSDLAQPGGERLDSGRIDPVVVGHEDSVGRQRIASPGTYDHKHFTRLAGIDDCVAYGPGILELAHQPDEYCGIEDLVNATKVIALSTLDLAGSAHGR